MDFLNHNFYQITAFVDQIRLISDRDDEQFNQLLKELVAQRSVDEQFKKELTDFCYLVLMLCTKKKWMSF